jgi:hypothetical protein
MDAYASLKGIEARGVVVRDGVMGAGRSVVRSPTGGCDVMTREPLLFFTICSHKTPGG